MGNDRYNPNPGNNPYRVTREPERNSNPNNYGQSSIDFDNQRICPACGKVIKISHNFCKFCGVDLSAIPPLGYSDRTLKQLAVTALTDPDPGVRKDAVETLGDLGENEVLGVFAYILLNDSDEEVRREAADELADFHHPHSLDVLAKALKDHSPIVRKEAIDGLKKIKKKNKPEKREEIVKKEDKEEEKEASELVKSESKVIEFSEEAEEEAEDITEDEDDEELFDEHEQDENEEY